MCFPETCSQLRSLTLTGGCYPAAILAGLLADRSRMPAWAELHLQAVDGIRAEHLEQLAAAGRLKVSERYVIKLTRRSIISS